MICTRKKSAFLCLDPLNQQLVTPGMANCCTCTAGLVAVVSAGSLSVGETCGDNLGLPGAQGHGAVDAAGGCRTPPGLGAMLRLSPVPSLEQRAVTDSSQDTTVADLG